MLNCIAPCYDKIKVHTSLALGAGLLLCALHGIAAEPLPHRPLRADDVYRVQTLSAPEVSPDGQWVAYVLTSNDRDADEARSAIWRVSWDGK